MADFTNPSLLEMSFIFMLASSVPPTKEPIKDFITSISPSAMPSPSVSKWWKTVSEWLKGLRVTVKLTV
ncbi:Phosphate-induced protein 1 [Corchorus capsularis]|uniref:Phosphate-induced protein 1 n=1 Tax=Corchorus capsularis TaxID=210143 RepID=A0A1R3HHV5_COCAP|nr:Phosphate-induced protein 1 [Corchorus capsularis]